MSERAVTRIGVVAAIEVDSVLAKYGEPRDTVRTHGCTVRTYTGEGFELLVLDSGAGEIAAAAGTQLLISEFRVDMILNFGVVGALTADMATAELCVVDRVIHYDLDTTGWLNLARGQYPEQASAYLPTDRALADKVLRIQPTLRRVTCASADKFVADPAEKARLHETYGADICEMEAAGIVLTCLRNEVPCLLIKAVSDSLTGGGAEFFTELARVSAVCFDLVDRVVREMTK